MISLFFLIVMSVLFRLIVVSIISFLRRRSLLRLLAGVNTVYRKHNRIDNCISTVCMFVVYIYIYIYRTCRVAVRELFVLCVL
jgi:hypothetical protein